MTDEPTTTSADVLRGLGLEVLVQVLEQSSYGVCVTGPEHEWVYVNPAGARLVGAPFERLRGMPYLDSFPAHERDALLALETDQREGDTGFYTNTVVRPDGTEREMTWSGTVVDVDGAQMAPAVFHDTTAVAKARREAEALAAAAAGVAAGGDTVEVLDALAQAAVATTRGTSALLLVDAGGTEGLRLRGRSTDSPGLAAAVASTGARLSDLPGAGLLRRGRPVHLADHRARLLSHDRWADVVRSMADVPWRGSALLPVRAGGEVVGELLVTLPPDVTGPTEGEVAFWVSLADQAAAALAEEELRRRTRRLAEAEERRRLGRDLHDSVSQSLFVLRQRAELVERAVARGDEKLVVGAAAGLREVAESALADMRALLDELRPPDAAGPQATEQKSTPNRPDRADGPTAGDGHDLTSRLRSLTATVTARHGLPVRLDVAPGAANPGLSPIAVTHVVRVVGEALHNVVKHAAARHAAVTLRLERDHGDGWALVVTTTDDGRGWNPSRPATAGHGRAAMAERAHACGGSLAVTSRDGFGTTVELRVPLPAAPDPSGIAPDGGPSAAH